MIAALSYRKFIAVLALSGIIGSIFAYVESFAGKSIDDLLPCVFLIGIGAIVFQIPIGIIERSSLQNRSFFWKEFARGLPGWVVPCVICFWLIALAHVVWFFYQSSGAVPVFVDGQYILSSRGRIIEVLTETEYLAFKSMELRIFATLMIACNLFAVIYWWFPRLPVAKT